VDGRLIGIREVAANKARKAFTSLIEQAGTFQQFVLGPHPLGFEDFLAIQVVAGNVPDHGRRSP